MQQFSSDIKQHFVEEYKSILRFWQQYSVDNENGGFYGEVDRKGRPVPDAPKGAVLNTRILWTFSSAYNFLKDEAYLELAHRAYRYLINNFWDKENGGILWSLNPKGEPLDSRKQIYAQGFAIYGLSEYYKATGNKESLGYAIKLFELIEKWAFDPRHGGYLEALSNDWGLMADMRLSAKDANEPKSMNTHLHIIEPYTNLYRVWPDEKLALQITRLIDVFITKIIDPQTAHFNLFFDMDWKAKSEMQSYGHDIEGTWLLCEAASVIGDKQLVEKVNEAALRMSEATLREGCAPDGSIYYENHPSTNYLEEERHWWVQAEGMLGFMNSWQLSGEKHYLEAAERLWNYIEKNFIDKEYGEWYLRIDVKGRAVLSDPKAGFWKCPYHNTRALMEMYHRITNSKIS
jgi:mannobiose 2-epimerase